MKRIVSLLVFVSLALTSACGGAEEDDRNSSGSSAPESQSQALTASPTEAAALVRTSESPGDAVLAQFCATSAYPLVPVMPELTTDFDQWDFTNRPLFDVTTVRSFYLVAFPSPVNSAQAYVYAIDVAARKILLAGLMSKRNVQNLTQRAGIDIGKYQLVGDSSTRATLIIQIDVPPPPPPGPNIDDPDLRAYSALAWKVAYGADVMGQQLSGALR